MELLSRKRIALAAAVGWCLLAIACTLQRPGGLAVHRWWAGLGPVVPHDSFPAQCSLCHEGDDWNTLHDSFAFDHEAETGVPLTGAHESAACLRCHNDRGAVAVFAAQGCAGCHGDPHQGQLGRGCTDCHGELTWRAEGQVALHDRTRFPLVGVHAMTACDRCHVGFEVGRFVPTDTACLSCHAADLARAVVPDHFALGYTQDCDRCHQPFTWDQAEE